MAKFSKVLELSGSRAMAFLYSEIAESNSPTLANWLPAVKYSLADCREFRPGFISGEGAAVPFSGEELNETELWLSS